MTKSLTRRAVLTLAASLATTPAMAQERPRTASSVTVFAAASLKTALDAVGAKWSAATGNTVTFSYAASGALAKQIENGAPADVFASADLKWMDYAAEKKLIASGSRTALLGNALVLVAPKGSASKLKIGKGFDLAGAIGDGKLATGDPKSVPAGAYAEAALKSLGVWEAVAPKIAGTDNVRAALAFVARGEAKFGIVYSTDAASEPNVEVIDTFPPDSHPPIVYPFALTATATNPAAAAFLAFLSSAEARSIFTAAGFMVLP